MTSQGADGLSAREAEVLEALGDHLTNAEIARQLHISIRTVESHVSSLLRKLDASDRRELATRAEVRAARPAIANAAILGLPGSWTSFVGRTTELSEIVDALVSSRLVTLLGPGGIGKTRLASLAAQQAAAAFPAGGAFVNLVPVSPEFVVQAVASSLRVVERAQESVLDVINERLRQGRTLIVLDNCEHVLGSVAACVEALLASGPDVVILATSRERLGVAGERVLTVPSLATGADGHEPDAIRLFTARAADVSGVEGDPTIIAEICRRLDGMPLAIELAAARSGSLGVDGLMAGLDDHLRLLSRSPRADDRHGSLRSVIDWSYQLLDDDERTVFRRLGIFAGAVDLRSAASVAADDDLARATDVLGRLADKSLLVHGHGPTGSRWRMLETVHAFAHEQLVDSGESGEVQRWHLRWATETAAALESVLDGDDSWRDQFDAVADDLRAALLACAPGTAPDHADFHLAGSLGHLAYARRFLVEAAAHLATAVDRAPDERAAVQALLTAADAAFAELRGDLTFERRWEAYERALAAGDCDVAAIALADAASIAGRAQGTFRNPLDHGRLVELVEMARQLGEDGDLVVAAHIAQAAAWDGARGPVVPEQAAAEEALRLAREVDDPVLISGALDAVASSAAYDGHLKEAARLTGERFELAVRLPRHDPRFGGEITDVFHMGAETAMGAGDLPHALDLARRSFDDVVLQGVVHVGASLLVPPLVLQGAFDDAIDYGDLMRDGWRRVGSPTAGWLAPAFFSMAMAHGLRGDATGSAEWWELAEQVSSYSRFNSFRRFAGPRLALHLGEIDRAAAMVESDSPVRSSSYDAYAEAMVVDVAVAAGSSDAGDRLASAKPLAAENDFVAASLARAAGVLHDDQAELERSVALWDAIGARFERACTLLLLPDRAATGHRELGALGCPPPASP